MLALGILMGILISFLCVFVILSSGPDGTELRSFSKKTKNQVLRRKVEFFDPGDTELDAAEELYKQNKKRGIDTEV